MLGCCDGWRCGRTPAFGVAKLAAEDTRERCRDTAEQQRHEGPEREVGSRAGSFVGCPLDVFTGAVLDHAHALLSFIGGKAGPHGDELGKIIAIIVVELTLAYGAPHDADGLGPCL